MILSIFNNWFFSIMGIIFCLMLLAGAFIYWATDKFSDDDKKFKTHP